LIENYDLKQSLPLKRHLDIFIKFIQIFIPEDDILGYVKQEFFSKLDILWKLWVDPKTNCLEIYKFY